MDRARDALIASLRAHGHPIRDIAARVGLSKSRVQQIASGLGDGSGYDDGDPWDADELDELDDVDALNAERWPLSPLTFVGYELQWFSRGEGNEGYWGLVERWIDAEGVSVGDEHESAEMALYRLRCHIVHELDDPERADELERDWQRQRDEYDAPVRR